MIVSAGLTAADDGKNDASTTNRFSTSCARQNGSRTDAVGSGDLSAPVAFDQPGNFNYRCALHPDNPAETGTVAVAALVNINAGANPLFGATSIPQGAGVVWQNNDTQSHQPMPDSGDAWLTGPIAAGSASTTVTFSSAGSFPYKCAVHPNATSETGTITVMST